MWVLVFLIRSSRAILLSGDISSNTKIFLETWRKHFEDQLNPQEDKTGPQRQINQNSYGDHSLNSNVTTSEIIAALRLLNDRKAEGIDEIPAGILKNQNLLTLIEVLVRKI